MERKAAIEGDTPSLTFDIIYSIFSRLPVKSLLRFRCVSKTWRIVISEPQFIKTHLNQSIKLDRQRLLCRAPIGYCFYSIDYEISDNSNEKMYLQLKENYMPMLFCSCNGFALLGFPYWKTRFVLWNPSTRAYQKLSSPYFFKYELCGLCYDSSIDDYKVVLITEAIDGKTLYVVFSFKGKSWTEARKFPYFAACNYHGNNSVNVNGVLYFKVRVSSDSGTVAIVIFDAVNEKFKKVPAPPSISKNMFNFCLMAVKGCLGLYYSFPYGTRTYIYAWEMNSWTRLMTIPHYLGGRCLNNYYGMTKLSCVTEKGEIVMVIEGKNIGVYNPKENKYREVETILELATIYWPLDTVVSFVDSLVLPTVD